MFAIYVISRAVKDWRSEKAEREAKGKGDDHDDHGAGN
jgi:hypothetical protein